MMGVVMVFGFLGKIASIITRIEQAIINHNKSPDFRTEPIGLSSSTSECQKTPRKQVLTDRVC